MNRGLPTTHVLDTNIFIEAARRYYPFDICPGFWSCLLHYSQTQRIVSVDRVWDEIQPGKDELTDWVTTTMTKSPFASTSTPEVVAEFGAMMQWVQNNNQFTVAAKSEFARVADGWVVAYAKAHDLVVVTHEVYIADVKKKVPMPNVCREFGVPYQDTFEFLRALDVRFDWIQP